MSAWAASTSAQSGRVRPRFRSGTHERSSTRPRAIETCSSTRDQPRRSSDRRGCFRSRTVVRAARPVRMPDARPICRLATGSGPYNQRSALAEPSSCARRSAIGLLRGTTLAREEIALAANLKTALVTGAGSGIGRSIATTLAEMGLRVALVGRDREKLERTRADFAKGRDSAFVATCDITDRFAVKSLVDQVMAAFEIDRRPGLQRRHQRQEPQPGVARPGRLGSDDRHQPHRLVQPGPLCPAVDAAAEERAGDPDLLGLGHACQHAGRRRLLGLEVRPGGPGHLPGTRGRALTAFARR